MPMLQGEAFAHDGGAGGVWAIARAGQHCGTPESRATMSFCLAWISRLANQ